MEVKIKQGNEMLDATIEMVDGVMVVSPKEEKYEPKDGDIVYVKTNHENIIICKEQQNKVGRYVNYFNEQYLHIDTCDFCGSIHDITEIRPATEEEKKKLFDKLAEEGYEFDFEKKELVKLKWKPNYTDSYWSPSLYDSEFMPWKNSWNNSEIGNKRLGKGWVFRSEEECQEFCNRLNDAINSVKP